MMMVSAKAEKRGLIKTVVNKNSEVEIDTEMEMDTTGDMSDLQVRPKSGVKRGLGEVEMAEGEEDSGESHKKMKLDPR
jgi:hypothetical protein